MQPATFLLHVYFCHVNDSCRHTISCAGTVFRFPAQKFGSLLFGSLMASLLAAMSADRLGESSDLWYIGKATPL